MTRYIIGDTETTTVGPEREAVDIAMMEIDGDLNIIGTAETVLMPRGPIAPEAQAVHGLTLERLKELNAPYIEQWVESTFGGILEGDVTLCGHRVGFDLPMFHGKVCNVVRVLDTLPLAFEYVTDAPNKKLETLKAHLGFPSMGDQHRAMPDVWDCYHLIKHLCEVTGRSLEELITTPYTVHYMPWGKHEGTLLHMVPRSYREYILGFEDLDPNLRRSLEQVALMDPPRREPVLGSRVRPAIPKRSFR
jgi:DNA polymerase III epsilon subunit-like protein